MTEIDAALAKLAAAQHCLIRLTDVTAVGGDRHLAYRRVRQSIWEECGHEVYRIAGVPWTYEARVLRSVFVAGDGAVASHFCAARLLGMGFPNAARELSVPRKRFHRPAGVTVHTSRDLDRCEVLERFGIPLTEPARVLLDLAGTRLGPVALRRVVEQARRLGLVEWSDLGRILATHARQGRRGIRKLREVLAEASVNDGVTETDSELFALSLLREMEFGEPTLQHEVRDPDGELIASLDFAYLPDLVNFEVDGSVHLQEDVRRKDDARDAALRRRGWTVRRIWYEIPLYEPAEFKRIVRETFRDARR